MSVRAMVRVDPLPEVSSIENPVAGVLSGLGIRYVPFRCAEPEMMSAGCTFSKSYLSAPTTVETPVPVVIASAGTAMVCDTSKSPSAFSPERPSRLLAPVYESFTPASFSGPKMSSPGFSV
ncbi:hypothetical protein [Alistipes finegoldii]|uniref:hypothetical protein n=1 Tax=Alistipes finegoldii TaxID=214856 RepID=UPI00248C2AE9|nr:hypothetical protein [Alistipes finegoldii]